MVVLYQLKQQVKRSSALYKFLRRIQRREFRARGRAEVFARIYRTNHWGDPDSVSGDGSNLTATEHIRSALPRLLRELGIQSMVDAPCGDFHWMQQVDLHGISYLGVDIVPDLIEANTERFARPGRTFDLLDLVTDKLPTVDLIFCRDCLIHLPDTDVLFVLHNVVNSGSRYLATTSFTARAKNSDILPGDWRPINLRAAPFYLGEPKMIIADGSAAFPDKVIALWSVADISDVLAQQRASARRR